MNPDSIRQILASLLSGKLSHEEAVASLARPGVADLGEVQLDTDRRRRCGFPEVVYGEGKSVPTLINVFRRQIQANENPLATRVNSEQAAGLASEFPNLHYNPIGRVATLTVRPVKQVGKVPIVTAGTTDLPVAEEARETLAWMGVHAFVIADVGVAGPHRLPARVHEFEGASAIIVVAGMEAALQSVVAGYVACPVIGVPTSVGYGANLGGLAALFTMVNSCAANVVVVNIDAGFKAAYVAGLIAKPSRHEGSPGASDGLQGAS